MRTSRIAGLLAVILCAILSIDSAAAQTLKIGMIAPLTGAGAPWGIAASEGARIAISEANAAGGVNVGGKHYTVELVLYDDQYKASEAIAAYARLVNEDHVKFLITMSSVTTMALKQSVEDDKILTMTSSYTSKAIDSNTHYMFRLLSTPPDYIPPIVEWMGKNEKGRNVAIINPNDETGWDLTTVAARIFTESGFKVVSREVFERSTNDFRPLLTKVLALQPDVIELGGTSPPTAGLIVRQARELGYSNVFSALGGSGPKEIVAAAGAKAAEGMVNMLYADPDNAGFQRIAAIFKSKIGQAPNEIIVPFYDAINVMLKVIVKSGTIDDTTKAAESSSQALPATSLQGEPLVYAPPTASGADPHQVLTVNYIGNIKNGQAVVVGIARPSPPQ